MGDPSHPSPGPVLVRPRSALKRPGSANVEGRANATPAAAQSASGSSAGMEPPDPADILQMALHLQMDATADPHLMWIAEEAYDAPLPEPWTEHYDEDGMVYFFNQEARVVSRDHPLDDFYRELYMVYRRMGAAYKRDYDLEASIAAKAAGRAVAAAQNSAMQSRTSGTFSPARSMRNPAFSNQHHQQHQQGAGSGADASGALAGVLSSLLDRRKDSDAVAQLLSRLLQGTAVTSEGDRVSQAQSSVAAAEKAAEKAAQDAAAAAAAAERESSAIAILKEQLQKAEAAAQAAAASAEQERTKAKMVDLQAKLEKAEADRAAALEAAENERAKAERLMERAVAAAAEAGTSRSEDSRMLVAMLQERLAEKERELESTRAALAAATANPPQSAEAQAKIDHLTEQLAKRDADLMEAVRALAVSTLATSALAPAKPPPTRTDGDRSGASSPTSRGRGAAPPQGDSAPLPSRQGPHVDPEELQRQLDLQRARLEEEGSAELARVTHELEGKFKGREAELQGQVAALQARKTLDAAGVRKLLLVRAQAAELRGALAGVRGSQEELEKWVMGRLTEALVQTRTLQSRVDKLGAAVSECESRMGPIMADRRRMFNELLQAKGNIRVFCRVRPLLETETFAGAESSAVTFLDDVGSRLIQLTSPSGTRVFEFDRSFRGTATQAQVFEDVQPLIQSVMDGYNVCVFAYGQTGSGKTFTMEGVPNDRGVTYRAFGELFRIAKESWGVYEYKFDVSLLEIYNETIRDLLIKKGTDDKKHEIKVADDNSVSVTNLLHEYVSTPDEFVALMRTGSRNRATGATKMNDHSSRSHLVMIIRVIMRDLSKRDGAPGSVTESKLSLVDLAGSERASKSEASGDRLREAQHINKSLSALGDVIAALTAAKRTPSSHIPFRNSKLTYLLSDSLGNDSKTLLFVNVSPAVSNAHESNCSLMFAARARNVDLRGGVGGAAAARSRFKEGLALPAISNGGGVAEPGDTSDGPRQSSLEATLRAAEAERDVLAVELEMARNVRSQREVALEQEAKQLQEAVARLERERDAALATKKLALEQNAELEDMPRALKKKDEEIRQLRAEVRSARRRLEETSSSSNSSGISGTIASMTTSTAAGGPISKIPYAANGGTMAAISEAAPCPPGGGIRLINNPLGGEDGMGGPERDAMGLGRDKTRGASAGSRASSGRTVGGSSPRDAEEGSVTRGRGAIGVPRVPTPEGGRPAGVGSGGNSQLPSPVSLRSQRSVSDMEKLKAAAEASGAWEAQVRSLSAANEALHEKVAVLEEEKTWLEEELERKEEQFRGLQLKHKNLVKRVVSSEGLVPRAPGSISIQGGIDGSGQGNGGGSG
eukprot:jgi/Mesvir1/24791/Mv22043-RA.1